MQRHDKGSNLLTRPTLPPAIFLDLDDTILAFDAGANRCWRLVCDRFTAELDGVSPQQLFDAIDESRTWAWSDPGRHRENRLNLTKTRRQIVSRAFEKLNVSRSSLVDQIADAYIEARTDSIEPFPGAIEAVQSLRSCGVLLALLTNGDGAEQRRKVEKFGLGPIFDHIHIEGEHGFGKPDERVYRYALRALNATPADTWMVGDNLEWEVAVPQSLGIYSIWIDAARNGLPTDTDVKPNRIIHSLTELVESR